MSFTDLFELPEADEPPGQAWTSVPAWVGPPQHELPVCVPVGVVIGRSENGVVALSHADAYSTGVSFQLRAEARGLRERDAQRLFHEQHQPPDGDELAPGFLRFGLELPGGGRVSNLGGHRGWHDPERPPPGPVLRMAGGGGGTSGAGTVSMRPGFWLWPVPEPGTIRVSCEWPLVGMPLSTLEIDGALLCDASARATSLWR